MTEKKTPDEPVSGSDARKDHSAYDLQFVPVEVDHSEEGGWYRRLPDAQLEVMTHARMHREPLGDADPEAKAREVLVHLVRQQKQS